MGTKYKLQGFNNLTKTLSINFYLVYHIGCEADQEHFIHHINNRYSASQLAVLLETVTDMIDANILNIAKQDYDPHGASVNLLISEGLIPIMEVDTSCNGGVIPSPQHIVGHLDKSHITIHTYPEIHPNQKVGTVRIDIDISTCGEISPLRALNYLITEFDADMLTIDYRVRGFTRHMNGQKLFIDHKIESIQDFISGSILERYIGYDHNIIKNNTFFTKLYLKEISLERHLIHCNGGHLAENEKRDIKNLLYQEMIDIIN